MWDCFIQQVGHHSTDRSKAFRNPPGRQEQPSKKAAFERKPCLRRAGSRGAGYTWIFGFSSWLLWEWNEFICKKHVASLLAYDKPSVRVHGCCYCCCGYCCHFMAEAFRQFLEWGLHLVAPFRRAQSEQWRKKKPYQGEPEKCYLSLEIKASVHSDVRFIDCFFSSSLWQPT